MLCLDVRTVFLLWISHWLVLHNEDKINTSCLYSNYSNALILSPLYMSDSVLDTKTSMISLTHVFLYSFSKYSLSQNLLLEALKEVLKA